MADDPLRSPFASPTDGQYVAAYETVHGAELAADQLEDAGFDRRDVVIAPAGTRPLPGWRARLQRRRHPMVGVTVGLMSFVALLTALTAATSWSLASASSAAVVGSAGIAALWSWAEGSWAAAVRKRARNDRRLIAQRFEIRCSRDVERARRVLARWWNPAAPPAGSGRA